jgi:hypothetical protein
MADIVCKQLGFVSGEIYTFGATNLLPTLPIVAGFASCDGTETNIFDCAEQTNPADWGPSAGNGAPADRNCELGCLGIDGLPGTLDDSVDPTCTHTIDQGVICRMADSPQDISPAIARCGANAAGRGELVQGGGSTQPVVFACVEYYTTKCAYDVTHNELQNNMGSYMKAMRAFAACADVSPEPVGYCHGSLLSAEKLANHEVCRGGVDDPATPDTDESLGATSDIGAP